MGIARDEAAVEADLGQKLPDPLVARPSVQALVDLERLADALSDR